MLSQSLSVYFNMNKLQVEENPENQSHAGIWFSLLFVGSILLVYVGFTAAYGFEVFSKNEKPFGIPYDEWVGKYWKWAISVTPEQSDPQNGSCLMNKTDSMVMVLQPAVGGKHQLECDITSKDAIMIPSWNAFMENNNKDDKPANYPPEQLSKLAKGADSGAVTSEVKVDGKSVAILNENTPEGGSTIVNTMQNFSEILAKPFNITIPENTFLSGQVPGTWPSGAHGWFAFLKPLPPGDHTVSYNLAVQGLGAENVSSETTYIFHVKSNQTGNSTMNTPPRDKMLNSNITNNSSSVNNTINGQVPPQSINGSNVPKI
jgi:hypothetical protein